MYTRPDWLTGANIVSLSRLLFIGLAWQEILRHNAPMATLWLVCGIATDFVDGFIAKHGWLGGTSTFGKILDPLLDKPMILVPLGVLAYEAFTSMETAIALWITSAMLLIVIRELMVVALKRSMVRMEGVIKSAGEHGRASMAFQSLGLVVLTPSVITYLHAMETLSAPSNQSVLRYYDLRDVAGMIMPCGFAIGLMIAASYVSGWVYFSQWRAMRRHQTKTRM